MKRSEMLKILARRLSNREVEDIRDMALDEMKYVQEAVLERLPQQPWFLETEVRRVLSPEEESLRFEPDYNGLMTTGGVWFAPVEPVEEEPEPPIEPPVEVSSAAVIFVPRFSFYGFFETVPVDDTYSPFQVSQIFGSMITEGLNFGVIDVEEDTGIAFAWVEAFLFNLPQPT